MATGDVRGNVRIERQAGEGKGRGYLLQKKATDLEIEADTGIVGLPAKPPCFCHSCVSHRAA